MSGRTYRRRRSLQRPPCVLGSCLLLVGLLVPVAVPKVLAAGAAATTSTSCRSRPLGLLSGEVKDWQLASSSVVSRAVDADCALKYARLQAPGSRAWCPENPKQGEWILVDLGVQSEVSGVMTQGRDKKDQWVTHFYISYSEDAYR